MGPPKKSRGDDDPLEPYRRIRKPLPPPGRVIPDKRKKKIERQAEREARKEER